MTRAQAEYERRQIRLAANRTDRVYKRDRAEAARMAEIERDRERELIYGFSAAHKQEKAQDA